MIFMEYQTKVIAYVDILGFKDLTNGTNLENELFKSDSPVNLKVDAEIYGPSFAMKIQKWAVGITTIRPA